MWSTTSIVKEESFGMTAPISLAYPTPADEQRNKELVEALDKFDAPESDDELNHRMDVLWRLNASVKEWIVEISLERGMPSEIAEQVGGKLCTFGSYKLGVHQKGADIDALCIAPHHISRWDFFTSFYTKLKNYPEVKELRSVQDAFVPVMKMNFDGIEIDLLFARLALQRVPDSLDLKDDAILKNLDDRCVRSLNGFRVTDDILRLVPNVETFRVAVRGVRLWAKQHGIYSNIFGFLGGVSWAMLVARTCQLYPNATAATIIQKFFLIFSQWKWPLPVFLTEPRIPRNLNFKIWDPRYNVADRAHLMPIITPSYPQQNSTYNVLRSTHHIITDKIKTALKSSVEILCGRASWQLLFEKPNFFAEYKHYVVLIASSSTKEEHLQWCGLVESKIRHLVSFLEKNPYITLAHPNSETFELKLGFFESERSDSPIKENCQVEQRLNSLWVIGLQFKTVERLCIDLTKEAQNFTNAVMKQAIAIKMYKETMKIETRYVRRRELKQYLPIEVIKRDRLASEILACVGENRGSDMTSPVTPPPPSPALQNICRSTFSINHAVEHAISTSQNTFPNTIGINLMKRRSNMPTDEETTPAKRRCLVESGPHFDNVPSWSSTSPEEEIIVLDSDDELGYVEDGLISTSTEAVEIIDSDLDDFNNVAMVHSSTEICA